MIVDCHTHIREYPGRLSGAYPAEAQARAHGVRLDFHVQQMMTGGARVSRTRAARSSAALGRVDGVACRSVLRASVGSESMTAGGFHAGRLRECSSSCPQITL
jgi:hypothetical protein